MKKMLTLILLLGAVVIMNGCGPWQLTECYQMEDGGVIGRHFDKWQNEDETDYFARKSFKPQIKSWWENETKKWPKFKRTCLNAADCYADSIEKESEVK